MLNSALRLPALAALLLCVSLAQAATIDGTIGATEYANPPVIDAGGETYDLGLDIDTVYTDQDTTDFFLGISVVGPAGTVFDFNGSDGSFLHMTAVYIGLYADDTAGASALHSIGFLLADNAGQVAVVSAAIDGTSIPLANYSVDAVAAFELSISLSKLPNLGSCTYLRLQVDDMGSQDDDQVAGIFIPEPATLTLLAVGGFLPLLRKKR